MGTCISKSLHKHQKNHNPSTFTEPNPPQDKLIISQSPAIPNIPPTPLIQPCSSSTPSISSSSSSSSSSIFTFNSSYYLSSNTNLKPPQITILDPGKKSPTSLNKKLREAHSVSIATNTCRKAPGYFLKKQNPLPSNRSSSAQPVSLSRNNNNNHSNLQKKLRETHSVSITANTCKKTPAHCLKKQNPLPPKRSSPAQPVSLQRNTSNHSNLQKKLREAQCKKAPAHYLKKPNPLPSKRSSPVQPVSLPRNNNKLRKAPPVSITATACKQVPSNGFSALNAGFNKARSRKNEVGVSSSADWGCGGEVISICIAGIPPSEDFDHPLVSMDCFIFV